MGMVQADTQSHLYLQTEENPSTQQPLSLKDFVTFDLCVMS